jgi:hypothetical protein
LLVVSLKAVQHVAVDIEQHEAAAEFVACVGQQPADAFRHLPVVELVLHVVR